MQRREVIERYGASTIVTYSGKFLDVLNPTPDMIDIEDIAIGLSRENRFANQTIAPYSVGQHSVIVSSLVPERYALQGLLHDAAEAYIKDLPSPLKHCLKSYEEVEETLIKVIYCKFKVEIGKEFVKKADRTALDFEWDQLFIEKNQKFCWDQEMTYLKFMKRFNEIM